MADNPAGPNLALAKDAIVHASNRLRNLLVAHSKPDPYLVSADVVRQAQPEIIAAAVLVFVNRFDSFSRKASGQVHRELQCLAVREFGVDPRWIYDPEDTAAADQLAWESQDPSKGPIPDLDEYDTRPETALIPRDGKPW